MSVGLLDVNFLIALAWPTHIHHASAQRWFKSNSQLGWATCPITETSFIRISTNTKVFTEALSIVDALLLLDKILALDFHEFWAADISFADSRIPMAALLGYKQITDAYLVGLATSRNGVLVTFDKGITALASAKAPSQAVVHVVPL